MISHPSSSIVCDTFDQYLCDPTYDGIDEITVNDTEPIFTPIEYNPIIYPPPSPLSFTPLDKKTAPHLVNHDQQNRIWDSTIALQVATTEAANSYEFIKEFTDNGNRKDDFICKQIDSGFAGLTLALQAICYVVVFAFLLIGWVSKSIAFAFVVATSTAYNSIVVTNENYAQDIYYNMFDDDGWVKWMYQSLNTINNNIHNENTEMLQDLQDRHEQMVNDINSNTVDTANNLGCQIFEAMGGTCTTRRRLSSNDLHEVALDVTWHWQGQAMGFMEMVGESVKAKIGDACESKPRGKGNKKPKSDKSGSNLFANEEEDDAEESNNRDLTEVGFEALMEEKLDGVYDSVTDIKTNVNVMEGNVADVKTDVVDMKDKMNMVEGKMNAFEADIADMKGKMDAMDGKVNTIEADVTDMKGKMDTIIEMMTQLLGQEKLVKE